ncbi:MAG: hypothetical protein FJ358_05760 [Thaumarchaeota archaeon]|nr:hypothetical protein [Nitrososphaerota archaeon]
MMKYRGPTDQYRVVERRYILRLVVGLAIIAVGVVATIFSATASQVQVFIPNQADPGAEPVPVQAPVRANTGLGMVTVIVGSVVNLISIRKYRSDYAEIKEKEPRPAGKFALVGLLLTLVIAAASIYVISGIA